MVTSLFLSFFFLKKNWVDLTSKVKYLWLISSLGTLLHLELISRHFGSS